MKDRDALRSCSSTKVPRVRNVIVWAALALSAVSVRGEPRAVPEDVDVAERFVVALNTGNVEKLVSASGCPFVFRNQEWESAKDGSGYIHGRSDDKVFAKKKSVRTFLGT